MFIIPLRTFICNWLSDYPADTGYEKQASATCLGPSPYKFWDYLLKDTEDSTSYNNLSTFRPCEPIPVAALSKTWVGGCSLAGIVGSNTPGEWMSIYCECCVLTGRGLCVWLIIRPEESYQQCVVMECDCEASIMRRAWPTSGCCAMEKKKSYDRYRVHNINSNLSCICVCTLQRILVLTLLVRDTPEYQNRS
jgi:hypothetical protein